MWLNVFANLTTTFTLFTSILSAARSTQTCEHLGLAKQIFLQTRWEFPHSFTSGSHWRPFSSLTTGYVDSLPLLFLLSYTNFLFIVYFFSFLLSTLEIFLIMSWNRQHQSTSAFEHFSTKNLFCSISAHKQGTVSSVLGVRRLAGNTDRNVSDGISEASHGWNDWNNAACCDTCSSWFNHVAVEDWLIFDRQLSLRRYRNMEWDRLVVRTDRASNWHNTEHAANRLRTARCRWKC